jgi:hypothetical protein
MDARRIGEYAVKVEYHGIDVGTRDHQAAMILHGNLPSPDVIELWLRVSFARVRDHVLHMAIRRAQLSPSPE